jgi:hypothetical protein
MRTKTDPRRTRIAALNDALRRNPMNRALGQVLLSSGIAARGAEFRTMVLAALARMQAKDFKRGNDPYGERDFNSFTIDGKLCLMKIDYFAKDDLRRASDDPADPERTTRVMTIMLAEDY